MPTNITIIHTQDFVRVTPTGATDLMASREMLMQLVSLLETAAEHHVLIDNRGAEIRLSTTDLFELGGELAMHPALARAKTALLVPPEEEPDAHFFETVARNRAANLRAFTEFEAAITWLIMKEQP